MSDELECINLYTAQFMRVGNMEEHQKKWLHTSRVQRHREWVSQDMNLTRFMTLLQPQREIRRSFREEDSNDESLTCRHTHVFRAVQWYKKCKSLPAMQILCNIHFPYPSPHPSHPSSTNYLALPGDHQPLKAVPGLVQQNCKLVLLLLHLHKQEGFKALVKALIR